MTGAFAPPALTLSAAARSQRVAIVGLGAIGSPLADAVARMRAVRGAVLTDPDLIERKNVWSQHIVAADVGRSKVSVHARRMRCINPHLPVQTWRMPVQHVPLGALRGAVILSAPDGREPRRYLSEIAWRLGAVLIDAGVEPTGGLVRVAVYVPDVDMACHTCLFSDEDYRQLEQRFPCADGTAAAAPTNAPAGLGLAAAALQTLELYKLLEGKLDQLLVSRQLVIDCMSHRHFVTTLRRNPVCRFPHDPPWKIVDLAHTPLELTIFQLLAVARPDASAPTLRVPGTSFISRLTCRLCGWQRTLLRVANRLRPAEQCCRVCGGGMLATGSDSCERLTPADLPAAMRKWPLSRLGLQPADIVSVGDGDRMHHLQLGRADRQPHHEEERHDGSNP